MIKRIKQFVKRILFKKEIERLKKERQIQYERCVPWFKAKGDETLRLNYPLNKDSVVFDLGGYKGEFAASIYNKYQSVIHVFEPVPSFYNIIEKAFADNDKVTAYKYGLAGKDGDMQISSTDDSSSVYITKGASQIIALKSIVNFIKTNDIDCVDLIKINIEGGEYEVLEALLDNNMISIFKNIQVQFHDFIIENARERMEAIQKRLTATHELTYQYDFVWENWKLKSK
ncbi:FkbM family methyltransferase [Pontimicrobium sp. MEBiC01747]